ncbi:unnamed protein product [Vitrella brassicaformis CCMP3155]|uniref:Condensin complex subunit 1 C-terminal domain-containing protein n=5 Tax=Vitrella brassicaformis TaxID=1169539 RepID=A0A0G4FCZ1_VITBC|nr:unnamed protein product [Vitrella brassicaformis CCMP3155]|eukprot:CEM10783.1 unnamed protein product [Vitrella brassicaformis CCMP3155]
MSFESAASALQNVPLSNVSRDHWKQFKSAEATDDLNLLIDGVPDDCTADGIHEIVKIAKQFAKGDAPAGEFWRAVKAEQTADGLDPCRALLCVVCQLLDAQERLMVQAAALYLAVLRIPGAAGHQFDVRPFLFRRLHSALKGLVTEGKVAKGQAGRKKKAKAKKPKKKQQGGDSGDDDMDDEKNDEDDDDGDNNREHIDLDAPEGAKLSDADMETLLKELTRFLKDCPPQAFASSGGLDALLPFLERLADIARKPKTPIAKEYAPEAILGMLLRVNELRSEGSLKARDPQAEAPPAAAAAAEGDDDDDEEGRAAPGGEGEDREGDDGAVVDLGDSIFVRVVGVAFKHLLPSLLMGRETLLPATTMNAELKGVRERATRVLTQLVEHCPALLHPIPFVDTNPQQDQDDEDASPPRRAPQPRSKKKAPARRRLQDSSSSSDGDDDDLDDLDDDMDLDEDEVGGGRSKHKSKKNDKDKKKPSGRRKKRRDGGDDEDYDEQLDHEARRKKKNRNAPKQQQQPRKKDSFADPLLALLQRMCLAAHERSDWRQGTADSVTAILAAVTTHHLAIAPPLPPPPDNQDQEAMDIDLSDDLVRSMGAVRIVKEMAGFLVCMLSAEKMSWRGEALEVAQRWLMASMGEIRGIEMVPPDLEAARGGEGGEGVGAAVSAVDLLWRELCKRAKDANALNRRRAISLALDLLQEHAADPQLLKRLIGKSTDPSTGAVWQAIDLRRVFQDCARDESKDTKKEAAVIMEKMGPLLVRSLGSTAEKLLRMFDPRVVEDLIMDASISVRKQVLSAVDIVYEVCPGSPEIRQLWAKVVLPCVVDPEGTVDAKALELVERRIVDELAALPTYFDPSCDVVYKARKKSRLKDINLPEGDGAGGGNGGGDGGDGDGDVVAHPRPQVLDLLDSLDGEGLEYMQRGVRKLRKVKGVIPLTWYATLHGIMKACLNARVPVEDWPLGVWCIYEEMTGLKKDGLQTELIVRSWHAAAPAKDILTLSPPPSREPTPRRSTRDLTVVERRHAIARRLLSVMNNIAEAIREKDAEAVATDLQARLKEFTAPPEVVQSMLHCLNGLLKGPAKKAGTNASKWTDGLLKIIKGALDALKYMPKEEEGSEEARKNDDKRRLRAKLMRNQSLLTRYLFTLGELSLLEGVTIQKTYVDTMQAIVMPSDDVHGQMQFHEDVRGHALLALAKVCRKPTDYSKQNIVDLIVSSLHKDEALIIRNNAIVAIGEVYSKNATLCDPRMNAVTQQLADPNPFLRKQTLLVLYKNVQGGHFKLSYSVTLFRMLYALADEHPKVREFAETFVINQIIKEQQQGGVDLRMVFVEAVVFFNGWRKHPKFDQIRRAKSNDAFILKLHPHKRQTILQFILNNVESVTKLYEIAQTLVNELIAIYDVGASPFGGPSQQPMPLPHSADDPQGCVLTDALRILCCRELYVRFGSKSDSSGGGQDKKDDQGGNVSPPAEPAANKKGAGGGGGGRGKKAAGGKGAAGGGEGGGSGKVKGMEVLENALLFNVWLKNEVIPQLSSLKKLCERCHSPVLREVHYCLGQLLSEHRDHLQDWLADDKELARELDHDFKAGMFDPQVALSPNPQQQQQQQDINGEDADDETAAAAAAPRPLSVKRTRLPLFLGQFQQPGGGGGGVRPSAVPQGGHGDPAGGGGGQGFRISGAAPLFRFRNSVIGGPRWTPAFGDVVAEAGGRGRGRRMSEAPGGRHNVADAVPPAPATAGIGLPRVPAERPNDAPPAPAVPAAVAANNNSAPPPAASTPGERQVMSSQEQMPPPDIPPQIVQSRQQPQPQQQERQQDDDEDDREEGRERERDGARPPSIRPKEKARAKGGVTRIERALAKAQQVESTKRKLRGNEREARDDEEDGDGDGEDGGGEQPKRRMHKGGRREAAAEDAHEDEEEGQEARETKRRRKPPKKPKNRIESGENE